VYSYKAGTPVAIHRFMWHVNRVSPLLCTNELRKWCSGHIHVGPPFLAVSLFSLCRGDHWPRARTTASSLDSGCGLSHECAQDGCNATCRSFKAHLKWKYGIHRLKTTSTERIQPKYRNLNILPIPSDRRREP